MLSRLGGIFPALKSLFKNPLFYLAVVILLAAFLRLYRLPEYIQFLGDEGRDALVVKRMIVDHEWTLLGPNASVGGFYTGPIYYYFMLPFMVIFWLDPVGPAVMSALFGVGLVVGVYLLVARFMGVKAALAASLIAAISPKLIYISRYSWNPNPVPFFSLLAIFFLYLSTKYRPKLFTFLAGVTVGILVQLHYIDLVFIPIIGIGLVFVAPFKLLPTRLACVVAGFLCGDLLYLLFEIRHGFPNIQMVWEFVTRSSRNVAPRSENPIWLFNDGARRLFEMVLGFRGNLLNLIYGSSLLAFCYWILKYFRQKAFRPAVIVLVVWVVVGIFGIGFYRGQLYDHYFGYLYPLPVILVGLLVSYFFSHKYTIPLGLGVIAILGYFAWKGAFFQFPPNNMLLQTERISKTIASLSGNRPFNFALITAGNSDHAYRFFLEKNNFKPIVIAPPQSDPKRKTVTGQLIIVCEGECAPLGNPLWEVAGFGRAEIDQKVTDPSGVNIYRLVPYISPAKI